jgi:primase-polymerase (primpol)-like protein
LSVEHCGSPVKAPVLCGRRRGRGSKRVREGHPQEEQKQRGGSSTATKAAHGRRKKEGTTTTTIVMTVPDFDGYQWKKYGQKQIEAAQHPR